jgi:hypothetical protein
MERDLSGKASRSFEGQGTRPDRRAGLASLVGALGLLTLVVAGAGCAPTLGAPYQRITQIPAGSGLVYVYRPNSFVGGAVSYVVSGPTGPITTLYRGGYQSYIARPGPNQFTASTETTSTAVINVEPGKVYFLRGKVTFGAVVGRPKLEQVSLDEGESQIRECRLIPRDGQ